MYPIFYHIRSLHRLHQTGPRADHLTLLDSVPVGHAEGRRPVKKSSYGEHDYAFGQRMLTLRTSIGLTQAGLARQLGISRQAVVEWPTNCATRCSL